MQIIRNAETPNTTFVEYDSLMVGISPQRQPHLIIRIGNKNYAYLLSREMMIEMSSALDQMSLQLGGADA